MVISGAILITITNQVKNNIDKIHRFDLLGRLFSNRVLSSICYCLLHYKKRNIHPHGEIVSKTCIVRMNLQ